MRHTLLASLFALVALSAGCASSTGTDAQAQQDATSADAQTQPDAPATSDEQLEPDGTCTSSLASGVAFAHFQACPATYSAVTVAALCVGNEGRSFGVSLGVCDGLARAQVNLGTHSWLCFYDGAGGPLVGRIENDDVPEYCNAQSSSRLSGRVSSCMPTSFNFNSLCSTVVDAGAGDVVGGG